MGWHFDVDYITNGLKENPTAMAEAVKLHEIQHIGKHKDTKHCASITIDRKTHRPRLNYYIDCVSSIAWHYRKIVGPKLARRERGRHHFRNADERYEYENSNDGLRDRIEELEEQNSKLRNELCELKQQKYDTSLKYVEKLRVQLEEAKGRNSVLSAQIGFALSREEQLKEELAVIRSLEI